MLELKACTTVPGSLKKKSFIKQQLLLHYMSRKTQLDIARRNAAQQ